MAAADAQTEETSGAPGSETPAPAPSVEPREPPKGRPFSKKTEEDVVAELRRKNAALEAQVGDLSRQLAEVAAGLQRLAEATGRADVLLTAATAEQVREAYNKGGQLRVLATFKRGDLTLMAGRTIAARHYPIDRLCDLVATNQLRLAVVPAAAKAA